MTRGVPYAVEIRRARINRERPRVFRLTIVACSLPWMLDELRSRRIKKAQCKLACLR